MRCQLSTHHGGAHYGLIHDLGAYGTALWLRWHGRAEVESKVLPDCPVVAQEADGEGCCLFIGHAGQHTWEDPLEETPTRDSIPDGGSRVAVAPPTTSRRSHLPRNESCGDCGGSGTNSSGKTCGTCDGLGGIHCRVGPHGLHTTSRPVIRKEGR
ncbi:hypothetical protein [Streptomyces sp. S07_1.15]|uniref:hypothetical protein n=1 Tax=Streptomyces sp. S07_1.15 TaxID=2873925 RepID=UPI0027DEE31F|nr:hypothetical protein [Streptomyces sp. S07_1.15]